MQEKWDYKMNVFSRKYLYGGTVECAEGLAEQLRAKGSSYAIKEDDLGEYPIRYNPKKMKLLGPFFSDSFILNVDYEAKKSRAYIPSELSSDDKCIDTIAWYSSFRKYKNWGIFIRKNTLFDVANSIFEKLNISGKNVTVEEKIERLIKLVIQHEKFHFITDLMAGQLEIIHSHPLYLNQKRPLLMEERMANAFALRAIQKLYPKRGFYDNTIDVAIDSIRIDGLPGYMEGPDYMSKSRYRLGLAELSKFYLKKSKNYQNKSIGGINWEGFYPSLSNVFEKVPIYLVEEKISSKAPGIDLFIKATKISFHKKFEKSLKKIKTPGIEKALDKVLSYCQENLHSSSLDFKMWGNPKHKIFSIRVTGGIRLHMKNINGAEFEAIDIGHHKQMGHG